MRRMVALLMLVAPGCGEHLSGGMEILYREGTLQFEPCSCNSGEELGYFGVELWDEDSGDVLVIEHTPIDGPQLAFWPGDARRLEFSVLPDDCQVFNGELKRTDDEIDEIAVMRGDIELDCQSLDGIGIHGRIEFDDCASLDAR